MKHLRVLFSVLALMACTMLHAQKTEATGTVVDAAGEPIIGATVMEKGTPNGTGRPHGCRGRGTDQRFEELV